MTTSTRTILARRLTFGVVLVSLAGHVVGQEELPAEVAFDPGGKTSAEMATASNDTNGVDQDLDAIEPGVNTSAEVATSVTRWKSNGQVMDRIELSRTEITGNQELPKVLYIVPWQKSDPGDLIGRPVNTLLDEVLAPLDREEFVRQVDFYGDLYGEPGE